MIIEKKESMITVDKKLNTVLRNVDFNKIDSSTVISVNELVEEVSSAMNFFDDENLTTIEKNNNAILINSSQIENKKIESENNVINSDRRKNNDSCKIQRVLTKLHNFRKRLINGNDISQNNNVSTISINQNKDQEQEQDQNKDQDQNKNPNLHLANIHICDSFDKKSEIESDKDLTEGNLFRNKNWRFEQRPPEEQLLKFSAGEVPTFEFVCKTKFGNDKSTEFCYSDNKLKNNYSENQNQTDNSGNLISNDSMLNTDNSDILKNESNNTAINLETKIMNLNIMKDKISDGNKQNYISNYSSAVAQELEQNTAKITEKNTERINVTENIENNKPFIFSVFKDEESLADDDKTFDTNLEKTVDQNLDQNLDKVIDKDIDLNISSSSKLLITMGLKKSYYKSKLKIPVLNGVNFTAYSGEFVSITGQSGSGKSTLLHLLGTLDKPEAGEIIFEGKRIDNLSVSIRDKLRNRCIGFIFQFYNLLPEFTALENVLSPLMIRDGVLRYFINRRNYIERAKELLNRVGLLHRLKHRPNELSGGEIQRVAIARSLIIEPKLLLADEPTGNLDSASAKDVIRILRELNKECNLTIVMVTHDNSVASIADRIVKMSDGVIN